MTILRTMLGRREGRALNGLQSLLEGRLGLKTFSGKHVTPENAMTVSAVYACVTLVSETAGTLPGDLLRREGDRRIDMSEHPYHSLLFEDPNPELTAPELWTQTIAWQLLRGGGYVYAPFDRAGRVTSLWPLPADRVQPVRIAENGNLAYVVNFGKRDLERPQVIEDGRVGLDSSVVWHFRGPGSGPVGYSPMWLGRQGVGVAMAAEEYEARFFENDATPGGVIQAPKTLSEAAYDRLVSNWNRLHKGAKNAHLLGLLEEGAVWQSTGLSNADGQMLELRRFQLQEIMRWFGPIPPHLISDVDRSTSWGTGIEQQSLGFVRFGLGRWINRNEATIRKRLLRDADPAGMYAKWNVKALERADLLRRTQALAIRRQWGTINADEWRAIEDENPIGGDAGTEYLNPLNFAPAGQASGDNLSEQDVREIVAATIGQLELNGHRV